ncbi:MAG: response regulator, partial [Fervidobacterium sp.]
AVEKAINEKYDLIFMDVLMPELDGLEATKKIRAVDLDTPIVALTAHALKNVKDEVLSVGMNDFVTKPVKIEEIERILEKFCGHLSIEISSSKENNNVMKKEDIEESETTDEKIKKINKIKESIEKTISEDSLDNEFAKDLLVTFLNSAKNSINNIISALKDRTFSTVQLEAHSIKGAARTLNLDEVADVAYEIEMHAKEKSVDFDYEKHLKILEDWINNFEIYYKKFFE